MSLPLYGNLYYSDDYILAKNSNSAIQKIFLIGNFLPQN